MTPSVKVQRLETPVSRPGEPRPAGLFRLVAVVALMLLASTLAAPALAWQCEGRVQRVHDGDTVSLRCERGLLKIRVANIDAPELQQTHGEEAKRALEKLTHQRPIRIDALAVDRYQRVVARLEDSGRDLGLLLVEQGHAWCGRRPDTRCRDVQSAAQEARRGLWKEPQPQPPWQWRREHPRTD